MPFAAPGSLYQKLAYSRRNCNCRSGFFFYHSKVLHKEDSVLLNIANENRHCMKENSHCAAGKLPLHPPSLRSMQTQQGRAPPGNTRCDGAGHQGGEHVHPGNGLPANSPLPSIYQDSSFDVHADFFNTSGLHTFSSLPTISNKQYPSTPTMKVFKTHTTYVIKN